MASERMELQGKSSGSGGEGFSSVTKLELKMKWARLLHRPIGGQSIGDRASPAAAASWPRPP
ncbi:hypothetical protein TYRP_005717 [Tyrophagus putrescentiae]|nr:hypothetical protein TYRP_005717 [Tyrophagus putrescentiae]